jgi:hypothetical protein
LGKGISFSCSILETQTKAAIAMYQWLSSLKIMPYASVGKVVFARKGI